MTVTRLSFASPILVLDDFLSAGDATVCLQECLDLRPTFRPASVGFGPDNRRDSKLRRNEVVMLDSAFRADRSRSSILTLLDARIRNVECTRLWHDGDLIFDIINYATWHESVLSRYGHCDFYGCHQDTIRDKTNPRSITRRLVTLVYYVNQEPECFQGGELTLYKAGNEITVRPRHNRAVVFPSFTCHAVGAVSMLDDGWPNARFSVNRWMGFE